MGHSGPGEEVGRLLQDPSPEVAANTAICLVCQATYLLDRLKKQLELAFLEHGGISERMCQARLRHRRAQEGEGE